MTCWYKDKIALSSIFLFVYNYREQTEQIKEATLATNNTIDRLIANPTIKELILFDTNGLILQTTADTTRAQTSRAQNFSLFSYETRKTVKNMDPTDELKFIRMRTKDIEIILAPEESGTLAILQGVSLYDPPYRPPKKKKNVTSTGGNCSTTTTTTTTKC